MRKIFVLGQNRIRVCLNEINLVVRCQAQIDAGITINREEAVNAFAGLLDFCVTAPDRDPPRTDFSDPSVFGILRPTSRYRSQFSARPLAFP